jgi:hypothetical protein
VTLSRLKVRFVLGLGVTLVAATAVSGATGTTPRKATIAVVDPDPVAIAGRGFFARERVTVKVTREGAVYRKVVTASRLGRLSAEWATLELPECSPYTVTATGARGSTASVRRILIPPACGIVLQP